MSVRASASLRALTLTFRPLCFITLETLAILRAGVRVWPVHYSHEVLSLLNEADSGLEKCPPELTGCSPLPGLGPA